MYIQTATNPDWVILLYRIQNIRKEVAVACLKVLHLYMARRINKTTEKPRTTPLFPQIQGTSHAD